MSKHLVGCSGDHGNDAVVVASIELPDPVTPDQLARVQNGYLCDDCGDVYRAAVATRGHPVGRPPDADLIIDLLPQLRPANYKPAHPPGPPSWARNAKPWPYPPRPQPPNQP